MTVHSSVPVSGIVINRKIGYSLLGITRIGLLMIGLSEGLQVRYADRLLCTTGAPQGTVLAPFLFTLYTADFVHKTTSCHLQKFSDDSAVVGLITDGDDRGYRGLVQDFVDWCLRNHLQINAGNTKELVVNFCRRSHSPLAPVNIQGTDIDTVKSYK
ncbi:hypothetical protein L3Q82_005685 [Scortum barcoo]|uniref:Uncharacterized protein n=1 Tax=Scortum barcoo TaxID=214431 RepID=A0ACB8V6F0_9TELE|nr:hypothetical protein L3Q82_005685 [Scortum barcoo]